jgi:F-type H+-transporting ATPase subunit delta
MDRRIARRYAKALVQLLDGQPGAARPAPPGAAQPVVGAASGAAASALESALLRDLERFCELYGASEELRAVLTNPSVPTAERDRLLQAVLDRLTGVHPLSRSFLRLLLRNQRVGEVEAVRQEFVRQLDERAGRVRADVTTAGALDLITKNKLQKALEQLFQKTVLVEARTDPALLAGIVTRVGHVVFDGSLRAQLERLREHLAAGN